MNYYTGLVLLLRTIWLIYRMWHLYESNVEFIDSVQKSKTYGSVITTMNYIELMKDCPSENIPYLLRLSEHGLSNDAVVLYKKVWEMSECITHLNPGFLVNQFMAIEYPDVSLELVLKNVEGIKQTEEKGSKDQSLTMSTLYQIGQQSMNYLFWKPTHTPLYDKWTEVQTSTKSYYRAYYQLHFLAVDISDELALFHRKFQQAIYTTWNIYANLAILSLDTTAVIIGYKGDDIVFLIEGANQWFNVY